MDGDSDGQAVKGRVAVKLRDVDGELNAHWLKEGSFVHRVSHVIQREYDHQVFFTINGGNFILLSIWIIRISSIGVKAEFDRLGVILETTAQLAGERLIEISLFEKSISCRILSIDLKRLTLCCASNCFLQKHLTIYVPYPSNVIFSNVERLVYGH